MVRSFLGPIYCFLIVLEIKACPVLTTGEMTLRPYLRKPVRYSSSVDSLANPEIFVVTESAAAYPAYVITFTESNK